jgi:hypothetical protein
MIRSALVYLLLAGSAVAEDPFVPLDLGGQASVVDRRSVRQDWIKTTNQRMAMSGKTLRVAMEGEGLTAVVLVRGVEKPRQAKPILLGKGEYASLVQQATGLGFTRLVVRNPETGKEWGARLEPGKKPVLNG